MQFPILSRLHREARTPEGNACSQFHQHFTYKFFVRTSFRQLFSSYMYVEKAAEMTFVGKKFVRKMLMKLTPGCAIICRIPKSV